MTSWLSRHAALLGEQRRTERGGTGCRPVSAPSLASSDRHAESPRRPEEHAAPSSAGAAGSASGSDQNPLRLPRAHGEAQGARDGEAVLEADASPASPTCEPRSLVVPPCRAGDKLQRSASPRTR